MKRRAALILAFALAFMFPYEADAGHPVSLTSAAYNANAGELTLTFSSALDGELNPWFLFIRDGATASTGGFILSAEHASSPASSSYTYHFSVAHRAAIAAMSDPHLHHTFRGGHGGGLYDNQHSVAVAEFTADISVTADTTKPALHATTAPAYDPDTGVLTLTLAEPVKAADADVDQSKIYINNSSTAGGGTSLNGATVSSTGNGATVTITPTQAQRAAVSGYETPHVYFTAGAVNDLSNNANAASSTAKALAIKPQLSPGKSGLADDGALTLGFKRTVKSADADVDQSKIHVRDGSGTTGGTALTGATVSSTGDSQRVAIEPTSVQRTAILGYAEPHVYFAAGAVTSATDVAIPASAASEPLSRQPELASASVDLNGFSRAAASQTGHYAGKLTLTFSEAVVAHTSATDTLPKITVREQDDSPALTLDATSAILTASDTSVVIALSPSQKEEVKAMSGSLEVLIAAQAFKSSLSSLPQRVVGDGDLTIASQDVTQDTTGPVAASAAVDEGTGILTLHFDEFVKDGAEVDLTKIFVDDGSFSSGGTALTGSEVTSSSDADAQATVKLSEALRKALIGYAAPHIRFDLGAVKDLGNSDMAASAASAEIDDTADTTPPTLVATGPTRPALDEGTGVLTLTFSESVKEGSDVDMEKIFIAGSATASGGTALSATGDVSELTSTADTDPEITIKLREAARLAAIGHATPYVYFTSGAVKDLSDQNVAASTVAAEIADTADDDPPKVASAALDEGTGILTVTFDETVDVSSGNGASFTIREAGAAAGSQGEVTLSDGEIQSGQSDGITFKFELDEDSRQGAIALSAPYLHVAAGAITDVISPTANGIAADADGTTIALTADGAAPTIASAEATASNKITVTFSETVKTADTAGEGWSISGTDSGSLQVSQNSNISSGSTTVVLTLSGNLPDTGPDIALRYETSGADVQGDPGSGSGAITDTSSNALAAMSSVAVSDGIAPSVSSAKYVSRSSVLLTFSEPVKLSGSSPAGWTVTGTDRGAATGAGSFATITTSTATSSDTLTLDNALADKTRLDFTLSYAGGNLEDAAGNGLGAYSAKPSDGIRPVIVSAESGELDKITVTFSEAVAATGTAGAGGWSLSGADSGSLLVSSRSDISSHSSELTLTLSGNLNDPIGTVALAYDDGAGDAKDRSDNALASQTVAVSQDLPPAIASAKATAPDKITVTFSEAVQTADTSGAGWSVSGTDAPSLQVTGSSAIPSPGQTTVVLTLSGNLADTKPDGVTLRYETSGTDVNNDPGSGSGAIVDASSKALAARADVAVSDGIKPVIESARITGPNQITIAYGEDVTAAQSHYASAQIGGARTISGLSGGTTDTHTLTFSGTAAGTDATGTVNLDATQVQDAAGNALGTSASLSRSLTDGQVPTITSATATSFTTIEVTFSESLASSGANAQGWSVSGGDAAGRTVVSSSGSGSSLVLTLSSDLDDTKPDGVLLRYKTSAGNVGSDDDSGSGAIRDGASNALAARSSIAVSDGIDPEIESAKVTGPNQATVTYSEDVLTSQSHYGSTVRVDGSDRNISGVQGGQVDRAVITFAGAVGTDATGNVTINSTLVEDVAGNALGTQTALQVTLTDGQAPTFTAQATALDEITVTFSESLPSYDAVGQGWSVSGGDADGRTVLSGSGSGSTLVLALSSDLDDTKPDGVLLRYKTSVGNVGTDASSGSGVLADSASNAVAARSSIPVSDGVAPEISSSKYTARNAVELEFSEPVRFASGSTPTGWAATGADAVASPTNASSITTLTTSSATSAAVLTLDSDLADKTLLDFTLSYSNGNIEDESDNALAPYSEKPDDGIKPRIASAESRALNEITVIFSEAVSATSTGASATWQLSGTGLPAGVTVSGNPAISSSHTVLRLSGNLGTPIGAVELAYVESAGDVQDGSNNALAAQSVSVSQNLIPAIVSAKVTGPNRATITYNEPVTASSGAYSGLTVGTARTITSYTQTSAAAHVLVFDGPAAGTGAAGNLTIDESKISDGVLNLGTSSVQRNLTDGQAPTFTADVTDSRTVTVAFSEQVSSSDNAAPHWTLSGADAQAVSSVSALSNSDTMAITVGADFATSVADLKISYSAAGTVSDAAGNVLASVSAAQVSDDQRPSIASAVAGTDNSITVTLTRNSAGSATDAGTTWTLSGTDAAGLSVSGYQGISSDTVTLQLSGNLPDTAPDLSLSYHAGVGDIADSAGRQMIDQTVPVSDGLKPRIDGAALNEGTGVLTVTFTEQVTVTSGLHLRESGSAGGIPLPSASGTVLSFTLSEAQRQQAVAFATPSLRMDAGAAADGAGLSSEAADVPVSATADAVPPVAVSAFLDLGTGILTVSFDENLGPAADPSPLSISGSLAGAQVSVSGSTATVTLTEPQRQVALGQTSPSLVLGAGAFRDVSGTGSSAVTLPLRTVPDDDRPRLVTAALNTDTSVLVLEFDETMDVSTFSAQLSHVRITGGAQEIQVSGTLSRDGVKVRVQVDRPTLDAVLDSISSSLRLETRSAQFEDTSGNAATSADVELVIGDDSPPRLVSASVISPDTVLAVFHEDLDGSTVQPSDFDVGGLAPVSASEERGTVTLKLDAEYDERSAPTVSLAGPVSDLFGNAQSSGSVRAVNNIVLVAISQFTVSASGGLAVAGEQISILFRATEPVQNPALSINGDAVPVTPAENGFTASYVVPPGSPQGPLSVSLSIESMTGTPASFTERDLTGPNVSVDTVVPAVASASSSGVDSVTVRYSEPVLADASGASVEVSSATYPVSVSGSGSETVLVYWDGAGSVPASAVLRGLAVRDIAGNPGPAGPVSAGPATDSASPGPTGVMPIARGTTLRAVTVPAGVEPALELSSASATDPRVLLAGGRTAAFENPLDVITREPGLPDLFFQAGTEAGGLGGLTVAGADLEAAVLVSPSDYEVPAGSPELDEYPQLRNPATAVLVGSPVSDIAFSKPVRIEFDAPLSGLVFAVGASGDVLPIPACAEGYGGAVPLLQEAPDLWQPETYDPLACVSGDSVWTLHFSVFGVAHRVSGGSECDDCTPPTLGYDAYGARLVDGGFAYNGLASDVEYFFTPYPLIESEVGKQNTVSLKIYENEGPQNVQHVSIAFGLRSGEVVSESRAVINYDIFADGTGALSVIDPENAIDDSLSASHETVECADGSALECLSVTVTHSFRAPLEFDIVGTDVWDSQRNSWQNYFNHGLRVTGESMNPVPGVAVNGGKLVLHPIAEGSNNIDVMAGEDGALYRLSPDGIYEPLRNISSLFHSIDESMYTYSGDPMQGYDRSDPEFAAALDEQIALAKAVLEQMNLGRQGWQEGFDEAEQSVHVAIDRLELLRADIAAERQRAEQVFLDRYGPTDRPE